MLDGPAKEVKKINEVVPEFQFVFWFLGLCENTIPMVEQ